VQHSSGALACSNPSPGSILGPAFHGDSLAEPTSYKGIQENAAALSAVNAAGRKCDLPSFPVR